jgi:hypothetical protein
VTAAHERGQQRTDKTRKKCVDKTVWVGGFARVVHCLPTATNPRHASKHAAQAGRGSEDEGRGGQRNSGARVLSALRACVRTLSLPSPALLCCVVVSPVAAVCAFLLTARVKGNQQTGWRLSLFVSLRFLFACPSLGQEGEQAQQHFAQAQHRPHKRRASDRGERGAGVTHACGVVWEHCA